MKMTFEDALDSIVKMCGFTVFENKAVYNRKISPVEVIEMIQDLRETYAPKIKMTAKQKQAIEVDLLDLFDVDSDTDWETGFIDEDSLGIVVVTELSGLAEDNVVRAWLHPELIEVVDG